jgi:hypothetical protein
MTMTTSRIGDFDAVVAGRRGFVVGSTPDTTTTQYDPVSNNNAFVGVNQALHDTSEDEDGADGEDVHKKTTMTSTTTSAKKNSLIVVIPVNDDDTEKEEDRGHQHDEDEKQHQLSPHRHDHEDHDHHSFFHHWNDFGHPLII